MSTTQKGLAACVGLAVVALLARDAGAYTIDSLATRSCHEEISAAALRNVRAVLPSAGPLPSTGKDDGPLVDDVPFDLPDDMKDIGGTTFLLGIRDNDLKNVSSTAIESLADLNSEPAGQREHCLRTDSQKEPTGSRDAVADCRAFIHDTLMSSLDGLDANGAPDPSKRETLEVSLAIRGKVKVDVPMFYLRAGRALHAIEDGFTHTFRAKADRHKITVVLNWINFANGNINEATDGPPHLSGMDRCDDPDTLLTERRVLATEAATAALQAVMDPSLSRDQKDQAVVAMLDKYLSFDETAGCTSDNNWCDAAENAYRAKGCGCGLVGGPTGKGAWLAWGAGLSACLLAFARKRKRRVGRAAPAVVAAGAAVTAALFATEARTQPHDGAHPPAAHHKPSASASASASGPISPVPVVAASTPPPPSSAPPVPVEVPKDAPVHETSGPLAALEGESKAAVPGTVDPAGAFFGRVSAGASYDNPGFQMGLGVRYQLGKPWMLGVDAEWNPWYTTLPKRVRAGTVNVYASLIRRYQLAYEKVNFRSTVSLGGSYLLSNLVGAESGSMGPFFGLSFLGVEFKIARGFFLTVDPTYIAFPIPHITGAPFGYYQYRFQVGLEFGGLDAEVSSTQVRRRACCVICCEPVLRRVSRRSSRGGRPRHPFRATS